MDFHQFASWARDAGYVVALVIGLVTILRGLPALSLLVVQVRQLLTLEPALTRLSIELSSGSGPSIKERIVHVEELVDKSVMDRSQINERILALEMRIGGLEDQVNRLLELNGKIVRINENQTEMLETVVRDKKNGQ